MLLWPVLSGSWTSLRKHLQLCRDPLAVGIVPWVLLAAVVQDKWEIWLWEAN